MTLCLLCGEQREVVYAPLTLLSDFGHPGIMLAVASDDEASVHLPLVEADIMHDSVIAAQEAQYDLSRV